MPVVSLVIEVRLSDTTTPRLKKLRADEILTKIRHHFNVAVADVSRASPDEPMALGLAAVGRTRREAREILDRVASAVSAYPRIAILRLAYDDL